MAHRLSLRTPLSTIRGSNPSLPAAASTAGRHVPIAARFAVRLAGVVALVGGGIALGRGVVGLAGARSNPIEVAGPAGDAPASASPSLVSAAPAAASETAAPGQPVVVASSLRSWAVPATVTAPSVDVQPPSGGSTPASPTAPAEAAAYTVASGDTLSQIAARFGTTSDAIVRANAITDPNVVTPGTVLSIPAGDNRADAPAPAAPPAGPAATVPTTRVPVVPVQLPAVRPAAAAPAQVPAVFGASSPDDAVRSFYDYLERGQFDSAAALWTQRMRSAYPPAENINSRFARTQALTLSRADVVQLDTANGRATVAVRLSEVVGPPTSTREYVGNWYLVQGATGWLLDQPNLQLN